MKKRLNHNGVSIIESVAAVVIISFVLITVFTIIVNARNQSLAAQEQSFAIEVASRARDNLINNGDYAALSSWMNGGSKTITSTDCSLEIPPFSCDLLLIDLNGTTYDNEITVEFLAQTADDLQFKTINFTVSIVYYANRTVQIEGIIYEK